jgi:sigma-B regulation protein RsbU (phosphoserine phosphatase)
MDRLPIDELLDTAPGGFAVFSEVGTIITINTTLVRMLGYAAKADILGKKIESFFLVAGKIFYQTHFFPLLTLQGQADEIFFRLRTKDGSDIPVICNAVRKPARDGLAEFHCLFVAATQRSKYEQELLLARKDAQQSLAQNRELMEAKAELEENAYRLDQRLAQLKQLNGDLVQFSKIISHDLQEPIRKIAVFSDKIASGGAGTVPIKLAEQFAKIKKECQVLRQLGGNLERFISLSVQNVDAMPVDLNVVCDIAFKMAATDQPAARLIRTSAALPFIVGYERQLEMLFYNIFKNSFQFRRPDVPVEITVEHVIYQQNLYQENKSRSRYTDFVKITISDNGLGFDEMDGVTHFVIEKKVPADVFGLSFGLAFCKKVVDNHQGEISMRSTAGVGTQVIFALPLSP